MRNLRKYFAVFVAVALLVTAIAPAFAADTADTATTPAAPAMTDSKVCETLGMIKGDGAGISDAYLKTSITRLQAAIMFLRLKGLEEKALAFTGKDNFADANKVEWDGGKAILGYLKANKDLGWQGDGTSFNPNGTITAQEYYKILLVSLGYVEGKDFKFEDTIKFADSKGLKVAAKADPFTVNDVAKSTVETLNANTADGKTTLIKSLVDAKIVDSAKAAAAGLVSTTTSKFTLDNTAKVLKVKFDAAPADATKVTFTVTRDTSITISATFVQDAKDKSLFTYTSASNLVAGEYKVAVKNDTADLGSQTKTVTAEKIDKIQIASKLINRRSDVEGFTTYKVLNQYGDDVTALPIASNITWQSSVGTIVANKGILTITKGTITNGALADTSYMANLRDYTTVPITITGYIVDSVSNATTTEQLTVSSTVGDIQSIKLLQISNKDKKTVIEKATTDVFYIDYEIKDSAGNLINDYSVLSSSAFSLLPTSSSIATAAVVKDPNDDKKALFQISVPSTNGIAGTQVITAVSNFTGKNATINVDVKEGSTVKEFVLQAPSKDVAVGDGAVEVPYVCLDSNGNTVTDYTKIKAAGIIFSSNISYTETNNPDGSYKLMIDFLNTTGPKTVTATVNTTSSSKMSQINVTVKDRAIPTTVGANPFETMIAYETTNKSGFSPADARQVGAFNILDQYDRPIDLRNYYKTFTVGSKSYVYFVEVTSSDASKVSVSYTNQVTAQPKDAQGNAVTGMVYGNARKVNFAAAGVGSATVSVNLKRLNLTDNVVESVNSKSVLVNVIDSKDLVSYAIEPIATLYANPDGYSPDTSLAYNDPSGNQMTNAQRNGIQSDFKVKGVTASGAKVFIPDGMIIGRAVSNPDKFGINGKKIYADMLGSGESTATAKATATVKGYNNIIYTTPAIDVSSSNAKPVATAIAVVMKNGNITPAVTAYSTSGSTVAKTAYNQAWTPQTITQNGDIYNVPKADFIGRFMKSDIAKYDSASVPTPVANAYTTTLDPFIMRTSNGAAKFMSKFAMVDQATAVTDKYAANYNGGVAAVDSWTDLLNAAPYFNPAMGANKGAKQYFGAGNDFNEADLFFEITDQYGKTILNPDYIQIVDCTKADKNGATVVPKYKMVNGMIMLGYGAVSNTTNEYQFTESDIVAGDYIVVTASRDGLSKTIKIVIQ